ncbi:MFS transporter [Paenibacillus gansuensis]|uniref:MFS transporter n=1 Tax=Paenibacillus gansuensis TaxID=306542 RepID=A0ABW5PB10_9BACL
MLKKQRYSILAFLFIASIINYLDRSALSIAAPFIKEDLEINAAQMGLIFSSFSIGYTIFNFIGGYSSDVYGPKKIMSTAMMVWSFFVGLTAGTYNFISLFIVRILFGFGEGPIASTQNKMVYNWFPTKERAGAVGIAYAGIPLGSALAGPVVGFIALQWGWRISFLILMLVGIVWTVLWIKKSKDFPKDHPAVSAKELEEIEQGQIALSEGISEGTKLTFFMKQPAILFTAVAFWSYSYILFFFLTWFPSYLTDAKNLSLKSMSIATMIPWIMGAIGQVLGGFLSNYIYKKTGRLMFSRKVVIVSGLIGTALCVILTAVVNSAAGAVILMSFAILLLYLTNSCYWAIIQDIVPKHRVGGVSGFVHSLANTAGIVAPAVTGFIIQLTGSFTSAFVLAGGLSFIGALCVGIFVKAIKQPAQPNPNLNI